MKKILLNSFVLVAVVTLLTSCSNEPKRTREVQYFPNMYVSVGYETYGENANFEDGMESRKPAAGSIARGSEFPFEYDSSAEGYELAKTNLKSPLDSLSVNLDQGKSLYTIYCASCHGKKGDGQGELAKREKFLGIPNYKDRDITEGSIYHVIMYGKNMMGSHASQLTEEERWQVTAYVQELRNN